MRIKYTYLTYNPCLTFLLVLALVTQTAGSPPFRDCTNLRKKPIPAHSNATKIPLINGPTCDTYSTITISTRSGVSGYVKGVYAIDKYIYVATDHGLFVSPNGGNYYDQRITADGLGSNDVYGVYGIGNTIYVATGNGLSISTDRGRTFVTKRVQETDLYSNMVRSVYAVSGPTGTTLYTATFSGLNISTDGGNTFTNYNTANGLGDEFVYGVMAIGDTVYAASEGGLSISTNGGKKFTNYTTTNGLGSNQVRGVYVVNNRIYAATRGGGLCISTDGGKSFISKTPANSRIGSHILNGVFAVNDKVYVSTDGAGLSISTDKGNTFTTPVALGGYVLGAYAIGNTIYVAVNGGMSVSTDGGNSFVSIGGKYGQVLQDNLVFDVAISGKTVYIATGRGLTIMADDASSYLTKTTNDGLGSDYIFGVRTVTGPNSTTVYAATINGVSISTDGGKTFINRTNGLQSLWVNDIYAVGNTIYAATRSGIGISTDGGNTFTTKIIGNGYGGYSVNGVYAIGNSIYAATDGGLSISIDGGNTFANYTTANGLGSNFVNDVYVSGSTIYVATYGGGLNISTDGGKTFITKTTANGLGANYQQEVYAIGSTVYVSTNSGLSISTDGGNTFTNYTTANGLARNGIRGMAVMENNTIYTAGDGGLSFCSSNAPLPVRLVSFSAQVQEKSTVKLSWVTASEQDNDYFVLERSKDLVQTEIVAQIKPKENSIFQEHNYTYIDEKPYSGTSYYRLRQVDLNGASTDYSWASVVLRAREYGVYPNPINQQRFSLQLDEPQTAKIDLYNVEGSSFPLQRLDSEGGSINLRTTQQLPTGIYILRIEERAQIRQHRVLVE